MVPVLYIVRLLSSISLAVFVYLLVTSSNDVSIDQAVFTEELKGLKCNRRELPKEENIGRQPNQALYDNIISAEPEKWLLTMPKIEKSTVLVILSTTSNMDYEGRKEIRRSWGSKEQPFIQNKTVRVLFVEGNDPEDLGCLIDEFNEHGNFLITRSEGTSKGLVYRLLIAYRYLTKRYPHVHVAKIDRDVIIDINQLMHLVNQQRAPDFIYGQVRYDITPNHHETKNRFVPVSVYSDLTFPWYVHDKFYLISNGALSKIMGATAGMKVLELEEVFFTGILRDKANLTVSCIPYFYYYQSRKNRCSSPFDGRLIGFHLGEKEGIEEKYNHMMTFKKNLCDMYKENGNK